MSNERSTISKIDDSSFIEEPSENVIAEVQEVKDSGRQRMLKIGGGHWFWNNPTCCHRCAMCYFSSKN
ncbi:unnamed protein product [Oikopleura dioica]|uniref:Uncharacterized protein n=1 Tax=Oikopleura dioica TaxID=34765 RepID=E4WSW9_OIKDI|nr:unnamed protein product [Oikopleura dioica]